MTDNHTLEFWEMFRTILSATEGDSESSFTRGAVDSWESFGRYLTYIHRDYSNRSEQWRKELTAAYDELAKLRSKVWEFEKPIIEMWDEALEINFQFDNAQRYSDRAAILKEFTTRDSSPVLWVFAALDQGTFYGGGKYYRADGSIAKIQIIKDVRDRFRNVLPAPHTLWLCKGIVDYAVAEYEKEQNKAVQALRDKLGGSALAPEELAMEWPTRPTTDEEDTDNG